LAVEDVYVNVCTMPAGPYDNQGKQAATEKYMQVAVHRTVQLMFGWKISLSTRTFMRLETN